LKWVLALLLLTGVAAQRRIDLNAPPWDAVMSAMQRRAEGDAQAELERIGQRQDLPAWQRAHAFSWAGELAERRGHLEEARSDYMHAHDDDAAGFEGRMACVKLGRIAVREQRWYEAERWFSRVEHDPDPIINAYANADLAAIRERVRHIVKRYGSIALLVLAFVPFAIRIARNIRREGVSRRFGRALLVAEAMAIVGVPIVKRWWSPLATSGWMAAAIPFGLVAALLWCTRREGRATWRDGVVVVAFAASMAAGLYLAADFLWWSANAA
jgi:hypothetical protein